MSINVNGTPRESITQRDLAEFQARRDEHAALGRQVKADRERLLGLVEAHAHVQAGPLRVRIKFRSQQRLTKSALTALIGDDEYDRLRKEAAPTVCEVLIIENDLSFGATARDRRSDQTRRQLEQRRDYETP